jgi:hypothetical protein
LYLSYTFGWSRCKVSRTHRKLGWRSTIRFSANLRVRLQESEVTRSLPSSQHEQEIASSTSHNTLESIEKPQLGASRGSLLSIVSSVSRKERERKYLRAGARGRNRSRRQGESRKGEAAGDSTQRGRCGDEDAGWGG